MDERLRFVARLLDGESKSKVCWSFGISRKAGYKIYNRYRDQGVEALCGRSRRHHDCWYASPGAPAGTCCWQPIHMTIRAYLVHTESFDWIYGFADKARKPFMPNPFSGSSQEKILVSLNYIK